MDKQSEAIIHTVLSSEKEAFTNHVNEVLKNDSDLKNVIPIPHDQVFDAMQDGIIFWYFSLLFQQNHQRSSKQQGPSNLPRGYQSPSFNNLPQNGEFEPGNRISPVYRLCSGQCPARVHHGEEVTHCAWTHLADHQGTLLLT